MRAGLNLRPASDTTAVQSGEGGEQEVMMELNKEAILAEMARMGKGVVKRIEVLK